MWAKIKAFFSGSETIFLARLQMFAGTTATVLTYVDPSLLQPVLPPKWFAVFLVANGIATEFLRRRRATDL